MKDTNDSWVDVVLGTVFAFGVLPAFVWFGLCL
jgi:hypothetical protein